MTGSNAKTWAARLVSRGIAAEARVRANGTGSVAIGSLRLSTRVQHAGPHWIQWIRFSDAVGRLLVEQAFETSDSELPAMVEWACAQVARLNRTC